MADRRPEFDPLTVELSGTHLVEANAGTGKTHSLASLVLRLVAEAHVDVRELALVTFTDAAARELRERLRARLAALARRLDDGDDEAGTDTVIEALRGRARDAGARDELRKRVVDALLRFDEASISTIHGFCRRALDRLGLPSGIGEPEDPAPARAALLVDFWRRRAIGGDALEAAWAMSWCPGPEPLEKALREAHELDPAALDPTPDPAALARMAQQMHEGHAAGRALWAQGAVDDTIDALAGGLYYKRDKSAYTQVARERMRDRLDRWFQAGDPTAWPLADVEALLPDTISRWMLKKQRAGWSPPDNALTRWAADWMLDAAAYARERRAQFLHDALAFVRAGMRRRRADSGVLTHDDVIADLHAALSAGADAAAALARRWRVGIVDEFQDTDARQYAIFARLFACAVDGRPAPALYLVGDPKQAIYRFRGGDIHAYGRAAAQADRHWSLSANWRADAPLVEAINTLFGRAAVRDPFLVGFIGYAPSHVADAREREASPWADGSPLVVWQRPHAGGRPANAATMTAFAAACTAAEIVVLLERARAHGVAPPEIAVLAATHAQAGLVGEALRRVRVPYASSGRDSVLAGDAGADVVALLRALLDGDPRSFRSARAHALFGLALPALAAAGGDDESDWAMRDTLRRRWTESGPLALLRELLAEVAPRWLAEPAGPQRYADVIQIGELLEACRAQGQGADAQMSWLSARRRAALAGEPPTRDEMPRSATSAGSVRVMTVHRSKGLQFDIVFAPFLWSRRGEPRNTLPNHPVKYHDDAGDLRVDLGSASWGDHRLRHRQEELAESLRFAYVALTRARHRVYTLWGRSTSSNEAPLAHLIHPATSQDGTQVAALDETAIDAGLRRLAVESNRTIAVRRIDAPPPGALLAPPPLPALAGRAFERRLSAERRILSFSALAAMGHADDPADRDAIAAVAVEEPAAMPGPIAAFPRGTRVGECVHAVLERVDFAAWPDATGDALLESTCRRHRFAPVEREVFAEWVGQAAGAELVPGLRLRDLPRQAQARELEFHFSLAGGAAGLGAALSLDPRYRREPAELARLPARFADLMHGYIDLVLQHDGRWYVVDYKSNFLGGELADYAPDALATAVRASDYDLQYLIYLVALHRQLRHRLGPRYAPARDLGGALYLFLRGMTGDGRAGVHRDRPPLAVIEALDRAFGAAGVAA